MVSIYSLPLHTGDDQPVEKSQANTTFFNEQENAQYIFPNSKNSHFVNEPHLPDLHKTYYQKLSENASRLTKAHAIFLQARQESLQQISNIIKLQMACIQNLFRLILTYTNSKTDIVNMFYLGES